MSVAPVKLCSIHCEIQLSTLSFFRKHERMSQKNVQSHSTRTDSGRLIFLSLEPEAATTGMRNIELFTLHTFLIRNTRMATQACVHTDL